jgi:hypothetical protein
MDPQIKSQLKQTINIATVSSLGSSGDPTVGTKTQVAARVTQKKSYVPGSDGVNQLSDYLVLTETELTFDKLIWLPADDTSASGRRPLAITPAVNEKGTVDYYVTAV